MEEDAEEEYMGQAKFKLFFNGGSSCELDPKAEALTSWLANNGSKFNVLEVQKYSEEVRGVCATHDVPAGEVIMSIPLKCLITVEMGQATAVGQAVRATGLILDAPKHVYLMLFLLVDRARGNSFFQPYYDILSPKLSNMPIFWSDEELEWLRGSHVLEQVEDRRDGIEQDYNAVCEVYPEFANIATLEDFAWARMCVCSRNFGIVVQGKRTSALVPYADMLNHCHQRQTKWGFSDNLNAFTITSQCHIPQGFQVYDSYGQKCNYRFLLNYGFSMENNVDLAGFCPNEVPILVKLDAQDKNYHCKISLFPDSSACNVRIRVSMNENENFHFLLSILRLICANDNELQLMTNNFKMRNTPRSWKNITFPLSLRNEVAVLTKLMSIVEGLIDGYPSKLEEDAARLNDKDLLPPFSNMRHAVVQVHGEKVVLKHYLSLTKSGLATASSGNTSAKIDVNCNPQFAYVTKTVQELCRNEEGVKKTETQLDVKCKAQYF
eukprot:272117_1